MCGAQRAPHHLVQRRRSQPLELRVSGPGAAAGPRPVPAARPAHPHARLPVRLPPRARARARPSRLRAGGGHRRRVRAKEAGLSAVRPGPLSSADDPPAPRLLQRGLRRARRGRGRKRARVVPGTRLPAPQLYPDVRPGSPCGPVPFEQVPLPQAVQGTDRRLAAGVFAPDADIEQLHAAARVGKTDLGGRGYGGLRLAELLQPPFP